MNQEVISKIDAFFASFTLRQYPKGQILLLGGDKAEHIYLLVKGKVKEYDVTYRGEEVILNVFKPPAFFPMSLAISKQPSRYIYEAETDIEVRQASASKVVDFIKTNPDVMFDLLGRIYKGVDGLLGRMVHLMTSSAKERLIYELLVEARRFGAMQNDGSCLLVINERELGARAGLSRETVSREVHKLKADGLIMFQGKEIHINNVAKLEQKLMQRP